MLLLSHHAVSNLEISNSYDIVHEGIPHARAVAVGLAGVDAGGQAGPPRPALLAGGNKYPPAYDERAAGEFLVCFARPLRGESAGDGYPRFSRAPGESAGDGCPRRRRPPSTAPGVVLPRSSYSSCGTVPRRIFSV